MAYKPWSQKIILTFLLIRARPYVTSNDLPFFDPPPPSSSDFLEQGVQIFRVKSNLDIMVRKIG